MASDIKYLNISSLRGGLNDNDPPLSLSDDSCTLAENVEWFYSTIGERRLGCVAINLPTTITTDPNIQAVTWGASYLPTNTQGDRELWLLAQNLTSSSNILVRRTASGWSTVPQTDTITSTSGLGHFLSSASLHGKFFIAHKSAQDRLHVWDGSSFRRAGLAAPIAAPTASDTGGGTYASARYFRVRFVALSGSTVLRRSEPSPTLTFTPSGSGAGALITRPAPVGEGETHWELEASTDNANFFRIARTVMATTTYTDLTVFAVGYSSGVTSEDLTSYTLVPSGKFLTIDSDRLIMAGSWENSAFASRVWWTPVFASSGAGNDERLDMTVNPYVDLDGFSGGEITGISRGVNGYIYIFKYGHIYKMTRTGQRSNAYEAVPITTARGAMPGSLVEAVDEAGYPAQYFLDPRIGPMRIASNGLEWCGRDLRNLWTRVNLSATVPSHGVFYQSKNQVHFWLAMDGADFPNFKLVLQCNEMRSGQDGARRGWSTVPVGDRISSAHCSFVFSNNVDSTDPRNQFLVPFIGKEQWSVNGSTIKNLVQQCDTANTDGFTTGDDDAFYTARVKTKPFAPASIINKCGVMSGLMVAEALRGAVNPVYIQAYTDFEPNARTYPIIVAPEDGEVVVQKQMDELGFSDCRTFQILMGDLNSNIQATSNWRLHNLVLKVRMEQTS